MRRFTPPLILALAAASPRGFAAVAAVATSPKTTGNDRTDQMPDDPISPALRR
jgi:hypothetical protein